MERLTIAQETRRLWRGMQPSNLRWSVIVPIKTPALAKSRLAIPAAHRETLAVAMAIDTLLAISACRVVDEIVVVTEDPATAHRAGLVSARVTTLLLPGPVGSLAGTADGAEPALNQALAHGASAAGAGRHRAAMTADLPALRAEDLEAALRRATRFDRAVVPDARREGTSLLTARAGVPWRSAFGPQSFARHRAMGHIPLRSRSIPSLRQDVDTRDDLEAARALGVGPTTASALLRTVDAPMADSRAGFPLDLTAAFVR